MRRILILALGLALAAGLFISPATAAPEPMHITGSSWGFQSVEQQGHIQNNTGCSWDPDDRYAVQAQGALEGGYQIATCVIADWVNHLLGLDFWTQSSRPFIASVEMGGHRFDWPSVQDGKYQRVRVCLTTPDYDHYFTGFQAVGDGVGVPTAIVWSMQLTGKRTNSATMTTQLVGNHSGHQADLCGATYTAPDSWPHCEGAPFVDGRVCYQ